MTLPLRLLVAAVLLVATAGCSAGDESTACIAVVHGHSEPDEPVPTTGARVAAVEPGCNDTDGAAEPDEQVEAQVIDGVPPRTAVLYEGEVYIREGARLPASAGAWFPSASCTVSTPFRLSGQWVGVSEPAAPHFDGVLDPPYDVVVDVERGPERYVGEALEVQVTAETSPVLAPGDLDRVPGATLRTTVRCVAGGFVALDIRTR